MRCKACNTKIILAPYIDTELCRECNKLAASIRNSTFMSAPEYAQTASMSALEALECGFQRIRTTESELGWDGVCSDGYHRQEGAPIAEYFDNYE